MSVMSAAVDGNIYVVPLGGECKGIFVVFKSTQKLVLEEEEGEVKGEVVFLPRNENLTVRRSGPNGEDFPRTFRADLVGPEGTVMEDTICYAATANDLHAVMLEHYASDKALCEYLRRIAG